MTEVVKNIGDAAVQTAAFFVGGDTGREAVSGGDPGRGVLIDAGGLAAGWGIAATGLAGTALTQMAVMGGVQIANRILAKKPGESSASPTSQSALVNTLSTVDEIPVIYGSRTVGATVCPIGVSGANGEKLHLLCIWGEGQISQVKNVYLDEVLTTNAKFAGLIVREDYVGTDGQAASAHLIAALADATKWNANCTLAGIAYTYLELTFDATVFGRGRPLITADIDGKLLYDPRTATTGFSRNPWLAIRDYLTNTRYGRSIAAAAIDDTTFQSAANVADATVATPNSTLNTIAVNAAGSGYAVNDLITLSGGTADVSAVLKVTAVSGGAITGVSVNNAGSYMATVSALGQASTSGAGVGATFNSATWNASAATQARYSCDGVLAVDDLALDSLRSLLSSCRGWLVFSGGKYKARTDSVTSATTFVLNEDNVIGGWSFQLPGSRTQFNRAKARFFDRNAQFQTNIVQWPAAGSSALTTYLAQDSSYVLEGRPLDLPYTSSLFNAQQIAQVEVKKSRGQILCSLTATIAATQLEIGDVVPVAHSTPGWPAAGDPGAGKLFRVLEVELLPTDEVRLSLASYRDADYTLDNLPAMNVPANTSLPDPTTCAAPSGLTFNETAYTWKDEGTLSWTASADAFVLEYQPEWKLSTDSSYTAFPPVPAPNTSLTIPATFNPGTYNFRCRAMNVLGARSSYTSQITATINAPTVPTVSGLELFNQAYSSTQFKGRDAKFVWRAASQQTSFDIGSEPSTWSGGGGAGSGAVDPFLKDYKTVIYNVDGSGNPTTVRRTEAENAVQDTNYTYTYEKNFEDGAGTPVRAFALKLWTRGRQNQLAAYPAQLSVSNPAPAAPTSIVLTPGPLSMMWKVVPAADADLAGVIVWRSTTPGFTPSGTDAGSGNCVYAGPDFAGLFNGLAENTTYYFVFACYDAFDKTSLTQSAQVSATTTNKLDAISTNLGHIVAGDITLDTAGFVKGGQSAYNTGTGFFLGYSSGAYKFSIGDGSSNYITWDGGTLTISAQLSAQNVVLTGTSPITLVSNTADGSDNKTVGLAGGGALGVSRGGQIQCIGNEDTSISESGSVLVVSGDDGAAHGVVKLKSGSGGVATLCLTAEKGGSVSIYDGTATTGRVDGFLYLPTSAGTPTGVPTAHNGKAVVYDTTNNKICVYNGAWKQTVALT